MQRCSAKLFIMISIVVCFKDEEMVNRLSENISETIGTEYELIKLDNRNQLYSLTAAYNLGASKAIFDKLCFIHEDVLFRTKNWGSKLLAHYEADTQIGAIGVAGSAYKIQMISSWWQPEIFGHEPKRINIVQHYKFTSDPVRQISINPKGELRSHVATLDGVFLSVKKSVWIKFRFDQGLLKGFHGYDMDFSLRVGKKLNNYVVFDILLEHLSEGKNDINWFRYNYLVHLKNRKLLPIIRMPELSVEQLKVVEKAYFDKSVNFATSFPMSKIESLKMMTSLIFHNKLFKPNCTFLKRFVIYLLSNVRENRY